MYLNIVGRSLSALVILLFGVNAARAEGVSIWDLNTLVGQAAAQHPSVLNAQQLSAAAGSDLDYAKRQRYPEMTVSSLAQSGKATAALVVKQPLWAAGAIDAAEAVSLASLRVQEIKAEEQALTIALRVVEAWQNYFLSHEKIFIIDEGLLQLQDLVDMMQRRVDAKVSPRVELELAKARVIQVQISRATLVAERDLALKRVEELVGVPVLLASESENLKRDGWLNAIRHGDAPLSGFEIDQVAQYQPTVRRVKYEADVAQAEIKQIESSQWPTVFLQYQQGINQELANDKRIGIAMEYAPGRGFSSRERVSSAVARAQARDINIQTAVRDARDQLNAKLQEMSRTQALERSWVPAVEASNKLLDSYRRQFIAGRKTWQEVLGQQNELTQARESLLDARVRWAAAYVQLRLFLASKAGGRLPGESLQPWARKEGLAVTASALPTDASAKLIKTELRDTQETSGALVESLRQAAAQQDQPTQNLEAKAEGAHEQLAWKRRWLASQLFIVTGEAELSISAPGREMLVAWANAMKRSGIRLEEISVVAHPAKTSGTPASALLQAKVMALQVSQVMKATGLLPERWEASWLDASTTNSPFCANVEIAVGKACADSNQWIEVEIKPVGGQKRVNARRGNS